MAKKWYNFFVTVAPSGEGSGGGVASSETGTSAQAVADIVAGLGEPPQFATLPADPTAFDQIYSAAEIPVPSHGYSILKIAEMLQSEHIRNLPAGVKRSSILVALDASGVKLQSIIEDAVQRDRALDTYERVQQKSFDDLATKKSEENQKIQQEMDRMVAEHRARIQANNDDVAKAKEKLSGWRLQKQQEEQKIYEAVSYFVTENPITTTGPSVAPPPTPKKLD